MNYYEILGVNRTATDDELKKAYRALAKTYHPDKFMSEPADIQKKMEDKFVKINEAYNVLSKKESRAEYDMKLSGRTGFNNSKKTSGEKTNYQDIYERFSKDGVNSMFGNFFNKEETEKAEDSEKMKNQTSSMFESFFNINKKGR